MSTLPAPTVTATGAPLVLRDLLAPALARHRKRVAVVAQGESWTYGDLEQAAQTRAAALTGAGVGPGDRVAVLLPNSAEYVVTDLAIALLGATKVALNGMLSVAEQVHILWDAQVCACVLTADRLPVVDAVRTRGLSPAIYLSGDDGIAPMTSAELPPPVTPADTLSPHGEAMIMYTGGTTGLPKGVVHNQNGLSLNLLSHLLEMEIDAEDRLLLTTPLPHSAGFLLQAALVKGATVYLEDRFDVETTLSRIAVDRVSFLFLVPTMIYRLLDAVSTSTVRTDLASVRTILYGAAPISADRLAEGMQIFGSVFVQLYGQSEAPNFLTRLRRDDHRLDPAGRTRLRSCGQPVAMSRVAIRDSSGNDCPPGDIGEVVAWTPYTMSGYLGLPEQTTEVLRDGWLHTGDLGFLDAEGFLFLVDRKKDMIITGGLNVYSTEVEQAISLLPGVKDVAVAGLPHPDWGEAVVAYVVLDQAQTTDGVAAQLRDALTSYKRPKRIVALDALPTTAVGKIDKAALRACTPDF